MAVRARDKLKSRKEKLFGDKKSEVSILIDSQKFIRAFPNVSNQIRYQKKRLQGMNPGMNPMMQNPNSFNNLNAMDSYQPPMGQMNPNIPNQNSMIPPSQTSNYQTEDIFAML